MNKHVLTLLGKPGESLRVPATLLQETVAALLDGARLATRFAVEGESSLMGPRPAWLDAACDVQITGLTAGSAVIALEAATLREIDPQRFGAQPWLFEESADGLGGQTAIDLFANVLADLVEKEPDDVLADRALLDGCARFARVSGGGFDGLRFEGIHGRPGPIEIRSSDAPRIERMRDETPRPQAARVSGTLDTVSASRADVVLVLRDGTRVPGRMEKHDLASLRSLLARPVVVSGLAHYRPSGRLLMLDVETLEPARPEDRIFERAPVPRKQKFVVESARPAEPSSVSTFFGTWPGEETDGELLEALRSIG